MRITGKYNLEIQNIFKHLKERHENIKSELEKVAERLRKRNKYMTKMLTNIRTLKDDINFSQDEDYNNSLVDSFGSGDLSSSIQSDDDG